MGVVHKALCFIALRLEDEPLSEMSVELEGTANCVDNICVICY